MTSHQRRKEERAKHINPKNVTIVTEDGGRKVVSFKAVNPTKEEVIANV